MPLSARSAGGLILAFAIGSCRSDSSIEARSPFATADSLRDLSRFHEMLPLYRGLRDSLAGTTDTANYWRAELWLAESFIRTQRRDSARVALTAATSLVGGDPHRDGWTRWLWCGLYSGLGRADSATAECRRAIAIAERIGDGQLEANAHRQLGTIQSRRGHYRESIAETERALELQRRYGRSPRQLAGLLNNMGIEYKSVGRLGEASRVYQEGLELATRFDSPWHRAYLYSNLASVNAMTGDLEGAVELMTASLRGGEQLADTQAMVYAHNTLAEYFTGAGNRAAARRHLEQSLAMNQRVAAYHRSTALTNLALLAVEESRLDEAARALVVALEFADQHDFETSRIGSRVGLSRLALARGDPPTALRWAEAALRIADSSADLEAELVARQARARALERMSRGRALDAYRGTIDLLESWRGRLALGDLRMGVADPYWSEYEGAIRALIENGEVEPAFAIAERARARLLLELMAERDASRRDSGRSQLLKQRLRARFAEWTDGDEPDRRLLNREIASLTDSLEALDGAAAATARLRNPVAAAVASVSELRAGLLGKGRGLLDFFWGDSAVYGWWITPEAIRGARLGSADSLAAIVTLLRGAVDNPNDSALWRPLARSVFRALVAPLGVDSASAIYAIPDGPLTYLPLEILIPPGDSLPWGARREFSYGPSASVLLALARAPAPSSWERAVLTVGNPTIGDGSRAAIERVGDGGKVLAQLPFAEDEARAVKGLFQAGGADLLTGRDATLARWEALDPARYRYLHFAAHAVIDDRRVERTGVLLSGGALDLASIRRLDLHSELVTLSACETALGKQIRGEGVIGLPHAFLSAGARGVIVTLWRIGDRSAAEFIPAFYAELRGGASPARALLAIRQRWLAAGGPNAHPSRWAPFILVGAGGPASARSTAPP